MMELHRLVAGVHQFQNNVFANQRKFFERLAKTQSPPGLFITCADSRVNPNLITQTQPGELFILRNIGNIVPPFTPHTADGAAAAAIEYAVTNLNVEFIIVCGHSRCGAVQGLFNLDDLKHMPSVRGWLANAESARRIVQENYKGLSEEAKLNVAVQENVLCQLENLRTHPSVAVRMARGDLQIFGWVYKLETGEVFGFSPEAGQFVSLRERAPESTAPQRLDMASI
jgi:carbonic anhydrase